MKRVAESVCDLAPAWLSSALGTAVAEAHAEPIGMGRMGATYRVHLRYEQDGGSAPTSVVAKLACGELSARQRMSLGYRKEHGFYTDLARTVDVRVPKCHYAAISDDGTNFTFLLADQSDAHAGVQVEGCTPSEAAAAVRNLAGLHAPRWNDETLRTHDYLTPIDETIAPLVVDMFVDATETFLGWYTYDLGSADQDTLRAVSKNIAAWHVARSAPFALMHGDYRVDNLLFANRDDTVVAVDWQGTTLGPPARDLAYFIATALDPEARRSEQRALVAEYHDALCARGTDDYGFEQCFDDYRLGQVHVPWITVLGATHATAGRSPETDEMFVSMASRFVCCDPRPRLARPALRAREEPRTATRARFAPRSARAGRGVLALSLWSKRCETGARDRLG